MVIGHQEAEQATGLDGAELAVVADEDELGVGVHLAPGSQGGGARTRPPERQHALRHFYASVLIDAGESVKAVAEYLGHADPGFTLRVYAHLFPASEERARAALDRVLNEAFEWPMSAERVP
jgi:hypothetical protein